MFVPVMTVKGLLAVVTVVFDEERKKKRVNKNHHSFNKASVTPMFDIRAKTSLSECDTRTTLKIVYYEVLTQSDK